MVESLVCLPNTEGALGINEIIENVVYPYEYFTFNDFQKPLNLTKEDFWSTLKQETPPDEEQTCTQEIIRKFSIKNGQELTMFYLQMDVLHLADVFENWVEKSVFMYGINPLYSYSVPGYTWKAGLKLTNIKLDFIKDTSKLASDKEISLLLENNIRGGVSSVMDDRQVLSDVNKHILYIDANNLYGWAMSQYL